MDRWMPMLAALGVAGGAGIGVAVLVFVAIPDDLGKPVAASAERAVVLDFGDGLVRDEEAVTEAYAQACDDGWGPACASGDFRGDLLAAEEALADHCDWDDPAACLVVGWARTRLTAEGEPAPGTEGMIWDGTAEAGRDHYAEREWRGADAFATGCKAGNGRSCAELGRCTGWGVGRKYSLEEAAVTFELACTLGSPVGCNWAGDAAQRMGGDGVPDYREACEMGLADGCRNLAGWDGSSAEERKRIWREGCETDARSCDFLARLLEEQGDPEAATYFELACAHQVCTHPGVRP